MGEKPHFYPPCLHRWELSSSSALWFSVKHKEYIPRTKSIGIMFILWKDYFRVLVDSTEPPWESDVQHQNPVEMIDLLVPLPLSWNYDVKLLHKFQIASTTKPLEEDKRVKSQDWGYKWSLLLQASVKWDGNNANIPSNKPTDQRQWLENCPSTRRSLERLFL